MGKQLKNTAVTLNLFMLIIIYIAALFSFTTTTQVLGADELTTYKVAVVQTSPTIYEKDQNIQHLLELVEEAAENGAKLIVTTEMATVGYMFTDREDIAPYVEPIPGPTTDLFFELAKEYHAYIVLGMAEVDPESDLYYNTVVLIGPEGIVGRYRKSHAYIIESRWAKDGDLGLPVYETELGKIGMVICYDIEHFETARVPSLMGADIITASLNWDLPPETVEDGGYDSWRPRSVENGVYLLASDRWGVEKGVPFSGASAIWDPEGIQLAKAGKYDDEIIYATVDLNMARDKTLNEQGDDRLADRRPDTYKIIAIDTHYWDEYIGSEELARTVVHGELPPAGEVTVAVAQFDPIDGNLSANMEKIEDLVSQAIELNAEVELIVFPELATTGYSETMETLAESIPGSTTEWLANISAQNNVFLAVGMPEEENGEMFNTAVLMGPSGFIGKYRKVHLNYLDETWATAGDSYPTFNTDLGRIGLLVGYDLMFPETARCLGKWGTDIVCAPSAWSYQDKEFVWIDRARFSNVHLAVANQYGTTYDGTEFTGKSSLYVSRWWGTITMGPDVGEAVEIYTFDTNDVRSKAYISRGISVWYTPIVIEEGAHPSDVVSQLDVFKEKASNLETELTSAMSEVSDLDVELSVMESEVTNLEANLVEKEEALTTAEAKISELETEVSELGSKVANATNQVYLGAGVGVIGIIAAIIVFMMGRK